MKHKFLLTTTLLSAFMMFISSSSVAQENKLNSPDSQLSVTLNLSGGKPTYSVSRAGAVCLENSPLGLKMDFEDLTQGLTLKESNIQPVKDEYSLKTIKQSRVTYEATEGVFQFEKDGRHALDIIFRVSNRDVAFRYVVYPKKGRLVGVVQSEASGFNLPDGTTTFLCPQSPELRDLLHPRRSRRQERLGRGLHLPLPLPSRRGALGLNLRDRHRWQLRGLSPA